MLPATTTQGFEMALGKTNDAGLRTTALVVAADPPLDNAPLWGAASKGTVRVLASVGPQATYTANDFKLDPDHWLVPGMEVPIAIDPGAPNKFEIDWDGVPSIEQRVAANDSTLADPRAARRRVTAALEDAGVTGPQLESLPDEIGAVLAKGKEAKQAATVDRFEEALAKAAGEPAPPGRLRAVVLIAATTASRAGRGPDGGGTERTTDGKRKVVLAVNVPGREPYAVLAPKFKRPRASGDVAGAGLPALVSATDPNDVQVLWEELPSVESQVGQRVSDALQGVAAEDAALQAGMSDAVQRAIAQGPPANLPTAPAGPPQQQPAAQQAMAESARQALRLVSDPKMRATMIKQYRAAGIEIDEE